VQRDTDGDGDPDITDPDDDGDGIPDDKEIEAGSDPKDPNSIPSTEILTPPTLGDIAKQTVVEGNAINPVTPEASENAKVEVSGLPEGVTVDGQTGTISGTPKVNDWGAVEEERTFTVTVKATDEKGLSTTKTFDIVVQRDTDGDGDPDITDPDDDGDGIPDDKEIEAGSDPKDPNS
ncbi:Ig domain-containing protein, partial [Facklamia sp. P12955]|uniref:Ig domain-containing protein n=1 Tax=Facklamia sp. P12955 TaxID=3421946 RepID=UPI003D17803F